MNMFVIFCPDYSNSVNPSWFCAAAPAYKQPSSNDGLVQPHLSTFGLRVAHNLISPIQA